MRSLRHRTRGAGRALLLHRLRDGVRHHPGRRARPVLRRARGMRPAAGRRAGGLDRGAHQPCRRRHGGGPDPARRTALRLVRVGHRAGAGADAGRAACHGELRHGPRVDPLGSAPHRPDSARRTHRGARVSPARARRGISPRSRPDGAARCRRVLRHEPHAALRVALHRVVRCHGAAVRRAVPLARPGGGDAGRTLVCGAVLCRCRGGPPAARAAHGPADRARRGAPLRARRRVDDHRP